MLHSKNSESDERNEYYIKNRLEMLKFIPSASKRVLDAGCGPGLFAQQVKNHFDAEVWGMEINRIYALEAEKLLDNVLQGDIFTLTPSLPDEYFDCIVLNDVLEHLIEPEKAVEGLKSKLKPGGVFVCSIPNIRYFKIVIEYLFHKNWQYKDHGILDRTHMRFFTKKSIIDFFRCSGLELTAIEGVNANHSFKYYCMNALLLGSLSDGQFLQYACVARK